MHAILCSLLVFELLQLPEGISSYVVHGSCVYNAHAACLMVHAYESTRETTGMQRCFVK